MPLPSLNVLDLANIFIVALLADNTLERSVVAILSTSITVAITRLPPSGCSFVNKTRPFFSWSCHLSCCGAACNAALCIVAGTAGTGSGYDRGLLHFLGIGGGRGPSKTRRQGNTAHHQGNAAHCQGDAACVIDREDITAVLGGAVLVALAGPPPPPPPLCHCIGGGRHGQCRGGKLTRGRNSWAQMCGRG